MQGARQEAEGSGFPVWPPNADAQRADTAPRARFIEFGVGVLIVTVMGDRAPLVVKELSQVPYW